MPTSRTPIYDTLIDELNRAYAELTDPAPTPPPTEDEAATADPREDTAAPHAAGDPG